MKVECSELPQDSHRASEEVLRDCTTEARKIVKRMHRMGIKGSNHVLVGHMSAGT